jgi:hypothetical protein
MLRADRGPQSAKRGPEEVLKRSETDRGPQSAKRGPEEVLKRSEAMVETQQTFCRICEALCGLEVTV